MIVVVVEPSALATDVVVAELLAPEEDGPLAEARSVAVEVEPTAGVVGSAIGLAAVEGLAP